MPANELPPAPRASILNAINLRKVLSLLGTLLTIKLLNVLASLTGVSRSSARFPNSYVGQAISHREHRIIHILLTIVPESTLLNDRLSTTGRPSSADMRPITADSAPSSSLAIPLMPVPSRVVRLSNCVTSRSMDLAIAGRGTEHDDQTSAQASVHFLGHQPLASDSVYSSIVRRSLSLSDPHSNSSSQRQSMLPGVRFSGFMSERLRFSIMSRPWSMDTVLADESQPDQVTLDMEQLQQTRSADSYPGRFPISDGLELSSLATAQCATNDTAKVEEVRTSVRPFTDV
ncbi:hypothetical protein ASPCADRAFT_130634 [Aspergillus carbonarius ITEM 5010]|uniref:Uncharacterized protein n=1 Tax=Aspergillus carbonarius (strain ITEM 5010) TaxID=602072 RepID=A0A1R3RKS1_ASPC5|nr:hypothetical protein ASPCADRAFT_507004 [Aspergillus carbonarius ITEM 5010]OOF95147.1 hypothetical protein ASPCADRAFT_130634 [Aspergillus carbonarius ITEM 5010]